MSDPTRMEFLDKFSPEEIFLVDFDDTEYVADNPHFMLYNTLIATIGVNRPHTQHVWLSSPLYNLGMKITLKDVYIP